MKTLLITALLLCSTLVFAGEKRVVIHVVDSHLQIHDQLGHTATLKVLMPDGSRAVLDCDSRVETAVLTFSRSCTDLNPGDYPAEIKGASVWITVDWPSEKQKYSSDGALLPRKTKPVRVKYQIVNATH